jgi:hypothetical protein
MIAAPGCAPTIRMVAVLPHTRMLPNHRSVASRKMLPKLYAAAYPLRQPCMRAGVVEGKIVRRDLGAEKLTRLSLAWYCQLGW